MATATVTTDFTTPNTGDSLTGWTLITGTKLNLSDDFFVEGTAAAGLNCNSAGLNGIYASVTNQDYRGKHLMVPSFSFLPFSEARVRVYDGANWGDWIVSAEQGPMNMFVVSVDRQFDYTSGTEPDRSSIDGIGVLYQHTAGAAKLQPAMGVDAIRVGTYFRVTGGTDITTEGNWVTADDIITWDEGATSRWYRFLELLNGVYVVRAHIQFGDPSGTAACNFRDSGVDFVAADQPVAPDFLGFEIVGNATGATRFQLGNKSTSGGQVITTGGCKFKSQNEAKPFGFICADNDVNALNLYDLTLTGGVEENAVTRAWWYDASITTYTEETTDANSSTTGDVTMFPATEAVDDAFVVGSQGKFNKVTVNLGTAAINGTTAPVLTWEYYNGASWSSLSGVTDLTEGFTAGIATKLAVTFTLPSDWGRLAINSTTPIYYVRCRISTINSGWSTNPVGTQFWVGGRSLIQIGDGTTELTSTVVDIANGAWAQMGLGALDLSNSSSSLLGLTVSGAADGLGLEVHALPTSGIDGFQVLPTNRGVILQDASTDWTGALFVGDGSGHGFESKVAGTHNFTSSTFSGFGPAEITFDTTSDVVEADDTVTLASAHGYVDGDAIRYYKRGGSAAIGLTDDTTYWVRAVSATKLGFYTTKAAAIADTGRIALTSTGAETHAIDSMAAAFFVNVTGTTTLNISSGANPSIRKVNGATVVLNNTVTVKVTVVDQDVAVVQNAWVYVQPTAGPFDDDTEIIRALTNASGVAETTSYNYTADTPVFVHVRKVGYADLDQVQTIKSTGLDIQATITAIPEGG